MRVVIVRLLYMDGDLHLHRIGSAFRLKLAAFSVPNWQWAHGLTTHLTHERVLHGASLRSSF